jgi:hypothetical protein
MLRHVLHDPVGSGAVRVDKGHPLAIADILDSHVLQQGRLTHACLADNVHVALAVLALNTKRNLLPAGVCRCKKSRVQIAAAALLAGADTQHPNAKTPLYSRTVHAPL